MPTKTFVAQLAAELGIAFAREKQDVALAAKQNGWNLEDAGRRLRLAFFTGLVAEQLATRVAVAHTSDDQAETVLAQILRGTGTTGLAGIFPTAGPIVRPLLGTRRQALRDYLHAINQPWREDATNADTQRTRARVRATCCR